VGEKGVYGGTDTDDDDDDAPDSVEPTETSASN